MDALPPLRYISYMQSGTEARIEALLAGLNEPQRCAVTHTDGPILILAGPGSGKTRVVTHRAAHLALTVARPWQILAITFTNKAAREMRDRIDTLDVGEGMTVSTFHAFCARTLRMYADRAGLERNFTILDRDDRRKMLKKAIERAELSTANWTPARAEYLISHAKNERCFVAEFEARADDWRHQQIAKIYRAYEKLQRENNTLDFDDLLMVTADLLRRDDELRDELESRYPYVLIDEYQDTNASQYAIAEMLTHERKNLCATGDPDQSIYGWRGADIGNILRFEEDFHDAAVVFLEQNYRSTRYILEAADALIAGNTNRKHKTLWTDNDQGRKVRVLKFEDGREEADAVAKDINRRICAGDSPSEIAVLYRINSLSRGVEEALIREGVAYQIARGVEFYNRKEIKDVLAYLRVLVNPADEIALTRIINAPPRGIGATTVERLLQRAGEFGITAAELILGEHDLAPLGRSAAKVRDFGVLLRNLAKALDLTPPEALKHVILHSGLQAMYAAEGEMDNQPLANLDELISAASTFSQERPESTLVDWLEHAALVSDVDSVAGGGGPVTLMTLHAAKGLEFENVYVIGLELGLLPFSREDEEEDDEEERRLCFVAMTRAKKRLTLTGARYRMLRGTTRRTTRSPFLDELPDSAIESTGRERKRSRRAGTAPTGALPPDIAEWSIGTLVEHPTEGLGQVMSMTRGGKRTLVDVAFKAGSRKTFAIEFADLRRVDFDDVG